VPPGYQQVEGERHGREQVCRKPPRVDKCADLAVGSLPVGDMDDLGGEVIAASEIRLPSLRRLPSSPT
jgi:hypothetical protein